MRLILLAENIALVILAFALVLTAYRLIKGPSLPDRVLALDMLAVISILLVACVAIVTSNPVLLDASLVLALLAFIGTVALSRYMEKGQ